MCMLQTNKLSRTEKLFDLFHLREWPPVAKFPSRGITRGGGGAYVNKVWTRCSAFWSSMLTKLRHFKSVYWYKILSLFCDKDRRIGSWIRRKTQFWLVAACVESGNPVTSLWKKNWQAICMHGLSWLCSSVVESIRVQMEGPDPDSIPRATLCFSSNPASIRNDPDKSDFLVCWFHYRPACSGAKKRLSMTSFKMDVSSTGILVSLLNFWLFHLCLLLVPRLQWTRRSRSFSPTYWHGLSKLPSGVQPKLFVSWVTLLT